MASECEAWEFQDGVVLLCLLEQHHIGLGDGGKAFQDVEFWEREALDIGRSEVLTFGIDDTCTQKGAPCRGRRGGICGLETLVSRHEAIICGGGCVEAVFFSP